MVFHSWMHLYYRDLCESIMCVGVCDSYEQKLMSVRTMILSPFFIWCEVAWRSTVSDFTKTLPSLRPWLKYIPSLVAQSSLSKWLKLITRCIQLASQFMASSLIVGIVLEGA